ncbi:unnamed protein product [Adineta ricciae]|uniref:Uncharacterized protein n=1 Tax=Adineta ricciae TaxID=249248 RepID=A0A815G6P7_ADIRI|nr:unnamed protein product [Adineta ricciae]CAF1334660.1 unnamed protein product [Adineta ricciae]
MSKNPELFYDNELYELLTKQTVYSDEVLQELNSILHKQPELAALYHPIDGSYLHILCRKSSEQENVAYRMVYALSNAGADPNVVDAKGNTPLHEVLIRGYLETGFDFIQALFRIGVDQRIVNKEGKVADAYLDDNPQLNALYGGYGEGIWNAIETSNIQETERLVKGFIKINCKHNSSQTLLDKAREINCTEIIRILADYQVTIEFVHSIIACDWDRATLVHQFEGQFIKVNVSDSIHTFTWTRATNRTYSKPLLEFCIDSKSSEPFELILNSTTLASKIDVNIMCTDGLPFFFHMFDKWISDDIHKQILTNANFGVKSCKGETFLFHLVHLYDRNENQQLVTTFEEILLNQPILLTVRNERGRTVVEEIELTPTLSYNKFRVFYEIIKNTLINQMRNNLFMERCILNGFGYHLLLLFNDDDVQLPKPVNDLLCPLKVRQGLVASMYELVQGISNDNFGQVQHLLKARANIHLAKDWSGRTCLHLAVLHRCRRILSFICENHVSLINMKDNLNRTALHYACIMHDDTAISILQQAKAKKTRDCFDLLPDDYQKNFDLCCEEFYAQGFPKNALEKELPEISDYLKIAFYFPLKNSIETNSINDLMALNNTMNQMGFYLADFDPNSYLNDWIRGQRYVPLIFVALEHRSVTAIQCLIELGLPLTGRMYITKSINSTNSRCVSFRSRAEELECFDIIGMINDLEDDNELKSIFKRHLSPANTPYSQSPIDAMSQVKRQKLPRDETMLTIRSNRTTDNNNSSKSQACILL